MNPDPLRIERLVSQVTKSLKHNNKHIDVITFCLLVSDEVIPKMILTPTTQKVTQE